jgi:hypothetical protein
MNRPSLILLCLCIALSSCDNGKNHTEYFNYYNSFEEGSFIQVENKGLIYKLQYRNPELLALIAMRGEKSIDKKKFQEIKEDYQEGSSFSIRIFSKSNGLILDRTTVGSDEYYKRIEMLNTEFPNLVVGVNANDTSYCQFHHFERTYNVQPFVQVLFNIPNSNGKDFDQLLFQDLIFNDGEIVVFPDFKNYKNHLPKLKL